MQKLYIAYGSNLNIRQMQTRCPGAQPVGTAVIKDYELLFKGSRTGSYLTIEKKKGSEVPVGIWAVSKYNEEALDRYEGYPDFYYKTEMKVQVKSFSTGKFLKRKAFVYIMHEERKLGTPSRTYVETCIEGYKDFGFNDEYLWNAVIKSRKED